ncbi:hypothetical protein EDB19DRAFT_1915275 [Suillus lakei]|nr:hypothetical protein EDB19DRAFT_1915275 [Suillus lakei]
MATHTFIRPSSCLRPYMLTYPTPLGSSTLPPFPVLRSDPLLSSTLGTSPACRSQVYHYQYLKSYVRSPRPIRRPLLITDVFFSYSPRLQRDCILRYEQRAYHLKRTLFGSANTNAVGLELSYEGSDLGVRSKLSLMHPSSSHSNLPPPVNSIQVPSRRSLQPSLSDLAPPMPKTMAPSPPTHHPHPRLLSPHLCNSPPLPYCTRKCNLTTPLTFADGTLHPSGNSIESSHNEIIQCNIHIMCCPYPFLRFTSHV